MIDTLKRFTTESLFDAVSALLTKLNIQFDRETARPISVSDLYDRSMPQYLIDAMAGIDKTYFIGIINDGSLQGEKSGESLESIAETVNSGGKYDGMFVFACDAKPGTVLTRTASAALTRAFNRISCASPVILFIRQGNLLSLSTCERMEYTQEWRQGTGEKLGKVSILRNINCAKPHRGHYDILEALGDKQYPTFDALYAHWMEVFSSELLTKKFYSELSDWYAWAVQIVKFPNDLHTDNDDAKYNHESCIRLITRLIFVWFLKQKHLIPEEFFDEDYIRNHFIQNFDPHDRQTLIYDPEQSKYYRLILQNLFFAMLNCPIVAEGKDKPNNRRFRAKVTGYHLNSSYNINNQMRYESDFMEGGAQKFVKLANSSVPFLNGGLFDCLDDKPRKLYFDGFSEYKESLAQLYFPDYLFFGEEVGAGIDLSQWYGDQSKKKVSARGIIDILKRYSFTVEENTPYDQEVSLDPELLGKVFENLLAAYNPETKTSARKQTGSFYTPREIVQYMVDESLVAHLKRLCGAELEPKYRQLLGYSEDEVVLSADERKSIMQALYNCRVLDPACGSGAFPMGMLQQMVHVLKKIDPTNEMWKDFMIDLAIEQSKSAFGAKSEEERKMRLDDIESAFNSSINDPDYARKLYLIEHCIYGVDIQPIAIQISKLRFFISLVVDQKPTADPVTNFGIRPLPNLEAKFVTANTLIPLDREENLFSSCEEIKQYENTLREINHKIFLAKKNSDKERLRELMDSTRRNMAQMLENLHFISAVGYNQLSSWNMFNQNASASFFDPEWMFGVKDGFDVVIGNPPYIQLQADGGKLGELFKNRNFESFIKTGDIYCLFYEEGYYLLREHGHLCFITSNKWMRAGYGEKLRGFFATKTNPKLLIDFAGVKIFESATVDTNILLYAKEKNQGMTISYEADKTDKYCIAKLGDYVRQHSSFQNFSYSNTWIILSQIEQSIKSKVEQRGVILKKWDISIFRGILTGYNEAFIISTEKRNEILSNCRDETERGKTEVLIRPILRGRDILRFGYNWGDKWLIATFPSKGYNIDDYPTLKQFLLSFGIERLEQTGEESVVNGQIVKARKRTNNKWFETQDSISYWDEFSKPKILWKRIGSILRFSYDDTGKMGLDSTCFATGNHLAYLCCVLNSKMGRYLLQDAPKTGTGDLLISVQAVEPLKIPKITDEINEKYHQLLNKALNSADVAGVMNEIDDAVYNEYGLDDSERMFIDNLLC